MTSLIFGIRTIHEHDETIKRKDQDPCPWIVYNSRPIWEVLGDNCYFFVAKEQIRYSCVGRYKGYMMSAYFHGS